MRRGTLALTLAFALGLGGMLSAEEGSGNWFTRLFTRSTDKKSITTKDGVPTLTPILPNIELIQAQANYQRRQSVCLKLREIAIATNDEDLVQKSEQLDQRAYDIYDRILRRTKSTQTPLGVIDLKDSNAIAKRAKGGR